MGLHPRPLWRWEPRDSNPHPAFGGLVKLLSASLRTLQSRNFFLACSLNGGLTPKHRANRKAHGRAMSFFVGTV